MIAFVTNVTERSQKSTSFGNRDLVYVTIMDDSSDTNAAKSEFAAWFPALPTSDPCNDLKRLCDMTGRLVPTPDLVTLRYDGNVLRCCQVPGRVEHVARDHLRRLGTLTHAPS